MNRLLCASCGWLAAGLLPGALQAQTTRSWGARLGGTLATRHYFDDNTRVAPGTYRPGLEGGLVGRLAGPGRWAGQAGLLYTQKGERVHHANIDFQTGGGNLPLYGDYTFTSRLHYLALPVSAVYAPRGAGQGWQFSVGAYAAACLGGHYSLTNAAPDAPEVGSGAITPVWGAGATFPGARARGVDAGAQAGVGYQRGALLAQAEYSLGLLPVNRGFGRPYYNGTGHLSLTYWFGTKA